MLRMDILISVVHVYTKKSSITFFPRRLYKVKLRFKKKCLGVCEVGGGTVIANITFPSTRILSILQKHNSLNLVFFF